MKKIFKNLIPVSTFTIMTLTSCACAGQEEKQKEIKTIKIVSDIDDITLMQNQSHTSKPLEVKCYSNDKEISLDVELKLTINENEEVPKWISITQNNEIFIDCPSEIGTYTFNISATNTQEQIHSLSKTFTVSVIEEARVIPDSISIDIENGYYAMYGEKNSIDTTVTPYKEGIETSKLIKECIFDIQVLNGENLDKSGNKLFYFSATTIDPQLIISADTDETFKKEYQLKIIASLIEKPEIYAEKIITLNIDNVKEFSDSNGNTYTRENGHESWTLSTIPSKTQYLEVTSECYQNKYVTKIASNLCSTSKVTKLIEVILPNNVVTIGESAFASESYLCNVAMPGVKNVGDQAFYNDVVLELDSDYDEPCLEVIGYKAFCCCYKLKISSLQNVKTIGEKAFIYGGLTSFEIGENCTEIGSQAFCYNYNLRSFIIHTKIPPVLGGGAFTNDDLLTAIQVPIASVEEYMAADNWKDLDKNFEGI